MESPSPSSSQTFLTPSVFAQIRWFSLEWFAGSRPVLRVEDGFAPCVRRKHRQLAYAALTGGVEPGRLLSGSPFCNHQLNIGQVLKPHSHRLGVLTRLSRTLSQRLGCCKSSSWNIGRRSEESGRTVGKSTTSAGHWSCYRHGKSMVFYVRCAMMWVVTDGFHHSGAWRSRWCSFWSWL